MVTDLDTQAMMTKQRLMCVQCACQLFLIPLVARRRRHFFQRTNTEPHKCVHYSQIDINMEHITWAELADIHFAHGAAYGNRKEA